jgi:hypothetical protein
MLVEGIFPGTPLAVIVGSGIATIVAFAAVVRALPQRLRPAVLRPAPASPAEGIEPEGNEVHAQGRAGDAP